MTRPAVIYFGPDGGTKNVREAKVFLRSLLFCTAKTGRILESMYVSLQRNESKQNFSVWVHGESSLVRGSGLFVGEEGVIASHHFLAPRDSTNFAFKEGTYHLQVFAKLVGTRDHLRLFSENLQVDAATAKGLATKRYGLYFDWGPDANRYIAHLEEGPPTTPTKYAPYENDRERLNDQNG